MNRFMTAEEKALVAETKGKIYLSLGLMGLAGIFMASLFENVGYVTPLFGTYVTFRLLGLTLTNIWVFLLTAACVYLVIAGLWERRKTKKLRAKA